MARGSAFVALCALVVFAGADAHRDWHEGGKRGHHHAGRAKHGHAHMMEHRHGHMVQTEKKVRNLCRGLIAARTACRSGQYGALFQALSLP